MSDTGEEENVEQRKIAFSTPPQERLDFTKKAPDPIYVLHTPTNEVEDLFR